jgi:hypothetical protein
MRASRASPIESLRGAVEASGSILPLGAPAAWGSGTLRIKTCVVVRCVLEELAFERWRLHGRAASALQVVPAADTSRRSRNWPSPPRSARSASLRLRPRLHSGTLRQGHRLIRFRVRTPPGVDPVAQRAVMDTEITGNLRDRFLGLDHHLHSLSLELRAEPTTLLGHEQILSLKTHCPRPLAHLSSSVCRGSCGCTRGSRSRSRRRPRSRCLRAREPAVGLRCWFRCARGCRSRSDRCGWS